MIWLLRNSADKGFLNSLIRVIADCNNKLKGSLAFMSMKASHQTHIFGTWSTAFGCFNVLLEIGDQASGDVIPTSKFFSHYQ